MKRPDLGPWLTKRARLVEYDTLYFWRMDRFVRSVRDIRDMLTWCDTHHKRLMSATEPALCYDPAAEGLQKMSSEILATVAAVAASLESGAIRERVADTHRWLRQQRLWQGGSVPLGYVPQELPTGHWTLVKSDHTYPVLREIVDRLLSSETRAEICRDFNARGVPSARNLTLEARGKPTMERPKEWKPGTLTLMFRYPVHLGYAMYNGEVLLDDDTGMPIQKYPPLITEDEYERLHRLYTDAEPRPGRGDNPVVGVVTCMSCGASMYLHSQTKRGVRHNYLKCTESSKKRELRNCAARMLPLESALLYLEEAYLENFGHHRTGTYVYRQGDDIAEQLSQAQGALELLLSRAGRVASPAATEIFDRQIEALENRIAALEDMPRRKAGYEWKGGAETNRSVWERSTWAERGELLRRERVKLAIHRVSGNSYTSHITMDPE